MSMNRRETKLLVENWRSLITEGDNASVVKKIDVLINKVLSKVLKGLVSKKSIQKYILLSLGHGDLKFSFESSLSESVVKNSLSRVLLEEKNDLNDKALDGYYKNLKKRASSKSSNYVNIFVGVLFIKKGLLGKLGKEGGYSGKSIKILGDILENCSDEEFEVIVDKLSSYLQKGNKKKLHSILKDKLNLKDELPKKSKRKNLGKDVKKLVDKSRTKRSRELYSKKLPKGFYIRKLNILLNDYKRFLKEGKTVNLEIVEEIENLLFSRKIEIQNQFGQEFKNIESDFTKEISKMIEDFIDKNNLHSMKGEVFKVILKSNPELDPYKDFKDRYVKNKVKSLKKGMDLSTIWSPKDLYQEIKWDKEIRDKLKRFRQARIEKSKEKAEKGDASEKDIMDKIHGDYKSGRRERGVQAGKTMKRYF